jgi:uncharacterized protein YdeI (YjbR/CyaY-like superfamily)
MPLPDALPDDVRAALATDDAARERFEQLPPSHRREYVDWITEAKKVETRQRRIAKTLEKLREEGMRR